MNPSPLLSIVIPIYNAARFLPRCLESLIGQTYTNLEIICVDDGSTDDSGRILDEYAARDARLKVLHRENAGVSAARNRGMALATGELITFVDADDWLEPGAYEQVIPCMQKGVDLVCFGSYVDGKVEDCCLAGMKEHQRVKFAGVQDAAQCIQRTDVFVWNKLFRKSIITAKGIRFPEDITCGEDAAFYFCYASVADKAFYLQEKLYHYVQQEGSAMARFRQRTPRGLDHLKVMGAVYDFYVANGNGNRMRSTYDKLFVQYLSFALNTTPSELYSELYRMAYELAVKNQVKCNRRYAEIRGMLARNSSKVGRIFHWFIQNRECYGIGGYALWSVTYEQNQSVTRFLGRKIYTVKYDEE